MKKTSFTHNINKQIFYKGKKEYIEKLIIETNLHLKQKYGCSLESLLLKTISDYSPNVELRSLRVGGMSYQIPFELTQKKQFFKIMKELRKIIQKHKNLSVSQKLFFELDSILKKTSLLLKKKEEIHKKAESALPFLHYKW